MKGRNAYEEYIGTALILGFRPQSDFVDWLIVIGLNLAISLLSVL